MSPRESAPLPARVHDLPIDLLRAGVEWLDSEQAPDAVVSHHGIGGTLGDYYVSVCPQAPSGGQPGSSVVVFTVREAVKVYEKGVANPALLNGIAPAERDALEERLTAITPVIDRWNGIGLGCETCSFAIARSPGAGVAQAKRNYVPFKTPNSVTTPEGWH